MATPLANAKKLFIDECERLLEIRLDKEAYHLYAAGCSGEDNPPSWLEMTTMTQNLYRNQVKKAVDDLMGCEKTWPSIKEEYNLPDSMEYYVPPNSKERFQEIVRLTYSIQEAKLDFSGHQLALRRGDPFWYPSYAARVRARAMNAAPAEAVNPNEEKDKDSDETVKKIDKGKKRPNESASETPVSSKKKKNTTLEKTADGKKAGHTATPHPKEGGKTDAKSPKSGGQDSSCSKKT